MTIIQNSIFYFGKIVYVSFFYNILYKFNIEFLLTIPIDKIAAIIFSQLFLFFVNSYLEV